MTDKQFRFARTSQCYCLGQRENACSKANCTQISATPCPEGATLDWGWPPSYGSGPFALATPCTHVSGRYSGPSKFKSRVAHPWSWDVGSSTSAAWTSLNMVLIPIRKIRALLFHGLCRLGKIDWASESHQELDRCLSRTITASKNFND